MLLNLCFVLNALGLLLEMYGAYRLFNSGKVLEALLLEGYATGGILYGPGVSLHTAHEFAQRSEAASLAQLKGTEIAGLSIAIGLLAQMVASLGERYLGNL